MMITSEEIAVKVRQLLNDSEVATMISGSVCYQREDYAKEDVVILPHTTDGESSLRFGQININIHVPDILNREASVYQINFPRLIEIRNKVAEVLQNHYELGEGYNWNIGRFNPPIKEQNFNEHFISIALELTIREKNMNQ